MPEFLTKAEVARRLSLSPRSVERLVRAGRIPPPVKLSARSIRFKEDDVRKALEALSHPAVTPEAVPAV